MEKMLYIKLLDNVNQGNLLDNVDIKGYSRLSKLRMPNKGIDISDNAIVYFFNQEIKKIDDELYMIPVSSVIIRNNELLKDGVVVEKYRVDQTANGYTSRSQEFFKVVTSTTDIIPIGALVICRAYSGYRFNEGKNSYWYIDTGNILLIATDEIKAGPGKILLQRPDYGPFDKQYKCKGISSDGIEYLFTHSLAAPTIGGESYFLVEEKSIIASF